MADLTVKQSRRLFQTWYVWRGRRVIATIRGAPALGEFWVDARGHPVFVVRRFADALDGIEARRKNNHSASSTAPTKRETAP
jgi:hypothetical protein